QLQLLIKIDYYNRYYSSNKYGKDIVVIVLYNGRNIVVVLYNSRNSIAVVIDVIACWWCFITAVIVLVVLMLLLVLFDGYYGLVVLLLYNGRYKNTVIEMVVVLLLYNGRYRPNIICFKALLFSTILVISLRNFD
ncbi:hypothetical protein V8F20_012869, partial [Naviculisporaceae sp. PSN 640]